jgi:acetoin utilization deacetylase AcuC-like enzyme
MSIRAFTDPRCLEHEVPPGYPELPSRLEQVIAGLEQAGIPVQETGEHPETGAAIEAVHDAGYVRRFQQAVSAGESFIDTGDNPLSSGSWRAARAAVDVCLCAADWVFEGSGRRAIAAVRPPGHHAERSMAMGFCYFNNVAVAAEHIRSSKGVERLVVVDFDVHHGNGTQHLFEDRGDVFYVSIHQHPFYPGTGTAPERGRNGGVGATLNVPLPAGSGDAVYEEVLQQVVLPSIRQFGPEAVLISAGFDAWQEDPVGGMRVSEQAFRDWGQWLGELADDLCHGRVLVTLEGGYDLAALPVLAAAHCQGLAG